MGKITLPSPQSLIYRILSSVWQLLLSLMYTVQAAQRNKLNIHASSCTYYFLVSLVPLLVLTGWGATALFNKSDVLYMLDNIPLITEIQQYTSSVGIATSKSIKAVGLFGGMYALWSASSLIRGLSAAFRMIFSNSSRSRNIIVSVISYFFIPLMIIIAIIFAFLSTAVTDVIKIVLDDMLNLVSYNIFAPIATTIISGVFVVITACAGFMLLAPKRPRFRVAMLGAFLFGIYFFLLQKGLTMVMANILNKYSIYGALGGLLVILLWAFLIFIGLFMSAQYTAVINDFRRLEYYRYLYFSLKTPSKIEKLIMRRIPFADDKYLTKYKEGDSHEFTRRALGAIAVKQGSIEIKYKNRSETVHHGGYRLFADRENDPVTIKVLHESRVLIIPQKVLYKLFKYYPHIWDNIELNEMR